MITDYKIILASKSPRRRELLGGLDLPFEVVIHEVDEIFPDDLPMEQIPIYLAILKAEPFYNELKSDTLVITADTIVAFGNEVLGKPKNKEEGKAMLQKLSGKTHQVYTGITLRNSEKMISKTDVSSVEIDHLTEEEINFYLENYRPFDKAGSYGIQEWFGMAKVKNISGSFIVFPKIIRLPNKRAISKNTSEVLIKYLVIVGIKQSLSFLIMFFFSNQLSR